ncbi:MAG: hypothetical protein NT027_13625 [Proteobacteria bacterium]|nr:hypothetical protein [Pseudomonadota bacterium]
MVKNKNKFRKHDVDVHSERQSSDPKNSDLNINSTIEGEREQKARGDSSHVQQISELSIATSSQLSEVRISSEDALWELVGNLNDLRKKGAIKLVSGSFDLGSIVQAQFIEVATGQKWLLKCLNDGPYGGGSLLKI